MSRLWFFNRLAFLRAFRQAQFAKALSRVPVESWIESGEAQIACNRLGLHSAVSECEWDGRELYPGAAIAGSQAVCGHERATSGIVRRIHSHRSTSGTRAYLAAALSPYFPELALSLLDIAKAPVALRVALLLRMDSVGEAVTVLREAPETVFVEHPELEFLAANAECVEASAKLRHLNRYPFTFGLNELELRDNRQGLSPVNVLPRSTISSVTGPCVSAIMTASNAADRVELAIASVMSQTWSNLELVVVDDASTSATSDAIARAAKKYCLLRHIRLPHNVGTYVAKAFCFEASTGELVTCHDSDDWAHPRRIELQMRPLMDNPKQVAMTSKSMRVMDDGTFYARLVYPHTRLNLASPRFRRHLVEKRAGYRDVSRATRHAESLVVKAIDLRVGVAKRVVCARSGLTRGTEFQVCVWWKGFFVWSPPVINFRRCRWWSKTSGLFVTVRVPAWRCWYSILARALLAGFGDAVASAETAFIEQPIRMYSRTRLLEVAA